MSNLGLVLVFALTASLAGACGDSKPDPGAQKKPAAAADKTPATDKNGLPMKFSPFTVETLRGLDGLVKVGDPWEPARSQFDARLGLSAYNNFGDQTWAVADGEDCWSTALTWGTDSTVKAVIPPTKLTAADGEAFEHCVSASGKNKCFRDGGDLEKCREQFPLIGN